MPPGREGVLARSLSSQLPSGKKLSNTRKSTGTESATQRR